MKKENIRVLVGRTQDAVNSRDNQCDDVREFDTIKEAKDFAKYALTDAYQQSGEMSQPMGYSAVMRGDECLYDYFRKEPRPAPAVKKPTATKRVRELLVDLDAAMQEFHSAVGIMADRSGKVTDSEASSAGIDKRRTEAKILVIAWHINLASKGLTPDTY